MDFYRNSSVACICVTLQSTCNLSWIYDMFNKYPEIFELSATLEEFNRSIRTWLFVQQLSCLLFFFSFPFLTITDDSIRYFRFEIAPRDSQWISFWLASLATSNSIWLIKKFLKTATAQICRFTFPCLLTIALSFLINLLQIHYYDSEV